MNKYERISTKSKPTEEGEGCEVVQVSLAAGKKAAKQFQMNQVQ